MKSLTKLLGIVALSLALAFASALPSMSPFTGGAAKAAVVNVSQTWYPNWKLVAYGDVTAAYSNATTSYTDVTGSSFTYTPTLNDCTTAGRLNNIGTTRACLIKVDWSFDVTKATSLTGNCGVYVNGALVASSVRYATFANRQTIAGVLVVANTVVGAQTIKMQCVSADTAAITVNNGHVVVSEAMPY